MLFEFAEGCYHWAKIEPFDILDKQETILNEEAIQIDTVLDAL